MDNKKFMTSTGEVISPDRMESLFRSCFESTAPAKGRLKGPKDLREFEDRIGNILLKFKEHFFGLTYEVTSGRWLKRDTSNETLVTALRDQENHFKKNGNLLLEALDPYQFLKLALEKDASLLDNDIYILGIERDRSGLTRPQKNVIAIQCAAQILWYLEKNKIPSIESMERRLIDESNPLYDLLMLHQFSKTNPNNPESRTVENWIRPMFPVPPDERKQKWNSKESYFENIMKIPGILTDKGTNFLKLRFALICLTRILRTFAWELDPILKSIFVQQIASPINFYPRMYVNDWVCEAFASNGNIFDS
jgi:hypothetical protein